MIDMPPGITTANEGFGNIVWNILGQTYTLKQQSEASMAWHAIFPSGTFVPPHIHPHQDEFVYVLSGRYDLWLDGKDFTATAGDLVRMPRGLPHGIFNKSGETATQPVLGGADAVAEGIVRTHPQPSRSGRGGSHCRRTRGQFPAAASLNVLVLSNFNRWTKRGRT